MTIASPTALTTAASTPPGASVSNPASGGIAGPPTLRYTFHAGPGRKCGAWMWVSTTKASACRAAIAGGSSAAAGLTLRS